MAEHALHRATLDFDAIRVRAHRSAADAVTTADTWPAVRAALAALGDRHSALLTPGAAPPPSHHDASSTVAAPQPSGRLLDGRYGYLNVPGYLGRDPAADTSYADALQTLIHRLNAAGVCGWIVDLRDNPGGNMWPMLAGLPPLLGDGEVGAFVDANGESSRWVFEVPDEEAGTCYEKLERRGVNFQRISIAEGNCRVDDAVMVNSPINGVTYRVNWAQSTTRFQTSCETALAIYESGALMREHDVDTVYHVGSYNCRNVRGGSSLSQHGLARAMDYAGFRTTGGTEYSVVRQWEHNTTNPTTAAGRVLRDIASGLERSFDRVLDADFNADHDDHFHAELTGR